jgi:hypothetical protein
VPYRLISTGGLILDKDEAKAYDEMVKKLPRLIALVAKMRAVILFYQRR